jgi:hypothetical protein
LKHLRQNDTQSLQQDRELASSLEQINIPGQQKTLHAAAAAAAVAEDAAASRRGDTARSHTPVVDLDDEIDVPVTASMPGAPLAAATPRTSPPSPSFMQRSNSSALHIEEVD